MDSPPTPSGGGAAYTCVARGTKVLQSHNPGRDRDLDAVAALCLEKAPLNHSWYSHTAGSRTYAFLIDDAHTYFAIVDGAAAPLPLLQSVRDGFKRGAARNGVHDELMPVLRSLRSSLESMSRSPTAPSADDGGPEEGEAAAAATTTTTTKAPLLGRNSSRVSRSGGGDDRAVRIDVPPPAEAAGTGTGALSLQKSLSGMKSRGVQTGRRVWWRHVKIVVVADLLLCLVLFGVWMAICRGFQCVSTSG